MWSEIAIWQERLNLRPDLSTKTIALYTQDARRFATWLQHEHPGLKVTEVTPTDAKTYRDHLLAKRYAPTTINRALISLMLFFDTLDGTNPFRHLACQCFSDEKSRVSGQRVTHSGTFPTAPPRTTHARFPCTWLSRTLAPFLYEVFRPIQSTFSP